MATVRTEESEIEHLVAAVSRSGELGDPPPEQPAARRRGGDLLATLARVRSARRAVERNTAERLGGLGRR